MEDNYAHVGEKLLAIREEISVAMKDACRKSGTVELIAVSKLQTEQAILAASLTGQKSFGENYVQEFLAKKELLTDDSLQWHFIGSLQSNKAKYITGKCAFIHSVDSLKLATAINNKAKNLSIVQKVLLQVNVGREGQKAGVLKEELASLTEELMSLENISVCGLMAIPPFGESLDVTRKHFASLREEKERLETLFNVQYQHLSMGMSDDFIEAIKEGATLVRVGTSIFGQRK